MDFASEFSDPNITQFVDGEIVGPNIGGDGFLDALDRIVARYSTGCCA